MLGIKIKSTAFGIGTVIAFDNKYITVEFSNKTTKFLYPDAFEKYIKAEDESVQKNILENIQAAKDLAEKKRLEEEAARKAAEEAKRQANTIHTSTRRKAKSIDEMFAPDYHAEKLARQPILTYQEVENEFGISISGFGRGINPTDSTVVLISSISKSGGNFVYHDKWTTDGDYLYSGEGKTGDQTMTKGNLAIKNAANDGKKIHLFVKFSPKEYYYQGIFELVEYYYEDEKDEDGNIRKEYKFRLRKEE